MASPNLSAEALSAQKQSSGSAVSSSMDVPYKSIIPGGLKVGSVITVQGFILPQPHSFEINLRHRFGIAFHYKSRFKVNAVVRNTWNGKWGKEELSEPMPFKGGELTMITIICGPDQYEVFVNGEIAHTYKHRFTDLKEIDVLEIQGDVQLTLVQL